MQVIKGSGSTYTLLDRKTGNVISAISKGNLKHNKVVVGDIVEVNVVNNVNIISKVAERKNILIRPVVSNIDKMCLVVASVPNTDFLNLDKQLLNCYYFGIEPIIVINKCDIENNEYIERIKKDYNFVKIVEISAKYNKNLDEFKQVLGCGLVALSGQSAVGKSSIINALTQKNIKVDGLCAKTDKGKHTTKHSEIHIIDNNLLLIDTPGFSTLELNNIMQNEIAFLMPDFIEHSSNCKFQPCSHITEPENCCSVKQAVKTGEISKNRYDNYVEIYSSIKPKWERRIRDEKNPNISFNTPRKRKDTKLR